MKVVVNSALTRALRFIFSPSQSTELYTAETAGEDGGERAFLLSATPTKTSEF